MGDAKIIDRLEVHWPNAARTVQVFKQVPVDRFVTAIEGQAALKLKKR